MTRKPRSIDFRALLIGALILIIHSCVHAQSAPVKDTVMNGTSYKIYTGSRGGRYVMLKDVNGNERKEYLSMLRRTNPTICIYKGADGKWYRDTDGCMKQGFFKCEEPNHKELIEFAIIPMKKG